MSDGLDDFFAKKDKKKKGKSKLTNNDLVNTEEVKEPKKIKKKSKESETKPAANSGSEPASEQTPAPEQTEEWSEYVEEKETDYSGLRIQSIQIRDEDQDQGDKDKDKGQDGDDEDGEEGAEPAASGVWSAISQPTSQQQSEPVEPPPKKEEPVVVAPPARSGGYVIPSKRSGASGVSLDPMPSRQQMRRKREAPNLKSEEDFPTLGGGPPDDAGGAWGAGRFEKVRSGGRVEEQSSRGPRLELGNKYDALRGGGD